MNKMSVDIKYPWPVPTAMVFVSLLLFTAMLRGPVHRSMVVVAFGSFALTIYSLAYRIRITTSEVHIRRGPFLNSSILLQDVTHLVQDRSSAIACLLLLFLAPVFSGLAQDETVFRSSTKLVQVSVIARDKEGKPVGDLRRDEFRVFDNETGRSIQLFLSPGDSNKAAVPPDLGLNSFSNRVSASGGWIQLRQSGRR